MNGFLLIDKPAGVSSFDIVRVLRKVTGVKKIGHCGTLDPFATGLLICAIGEATKLIEYLLKSEKSYLATMILGKTSNTYDSEGEIKDGSDYHNWNAEKLQKLMNQKFLGEISQIPPKFSALKIQGQRAYELARKGIDFEIKPRRAMIHQIELKSFAGSKVVFFVRCGSGTYIRSLANDIGEAMQCGAYLKDLRRTAVGKFSVEDACDLKLQIEKSEKGPRITSQTESAEIAKQLKRWELFNENFPQLEFSAEDKKRLMQGQRISNKQYFEGEFLAQSEEDFFGILEAKDGILKLKKQIRL